jgi:hypothetical protein
MMQNFFQKYLLYHMGFLILILGEGEGEWKGGGIKTITTTTVSTAFFMHSRKTVDFLRIFSSLLLYCKVILAACEKALKAYW